MGKDLTVGKISFGPLFDAFNETFKNIDKVFNEAWKETFQEVASKIDVKEDKKKVYVKADIPGFDKKDLKVDVKNGYILVEGSKTIKQKKDSTRRSVSLVSKLPADVTIKGADAEYKDGILKITLAKTPEAGSKITIK